jgi:Macrocin-O-methyltransferase (TylF)
MRAKLFPLTSIESVEGLCWRGALPDDADNGDDLADNQKSGLRVFEDGDELGPAHSLHETIGKRGAGAFSHWGRSLYFSPSDDSDPRTNGRRYDVLYQLGGRSRQTEILSAALAAVVESMGEEERYAWGERAFAAFVPEVHLSEYGRSYFRDHEFVADYERFGRSNYRSFDRKFALKELAKLAVRLDGDFAECGVFQGASAYLMAKVIGAAGASKRLHLFDSFSGVSEPTQHDGSYWKKGDLACDLSTVEANLAPQAHGISFYPGWIPERFREVASLRFALVHVDVDLYAPTRASLEFFAPRMVDGGIIICDDYGFITCPGARLAMDEIAETLGLPLVHLPTGQGVLFLVRSV